MNAFPIIDPSAAISTLPLSNRLSTVRQHQLQRLEYLQSELVSSNKYLSEYRTVLTQLHQLPTKLTHSIMVPFGSLAFHNGYIEHTNEITVLLGDNYFIKTTANKAAAIINRRIKIIQEKQNKLNGEIELIQSSWDTSKQIFNTETTASAANTDGTVYDPISGKLLNESGDEIVEIKEEYISDSDNEESSESEEIIEIKSNKNNNNNNNKTASLAAAATVPAPVPTPATAATTNSTELDLSAVNSYSSTTNPTEFDAFWSELDRLDQEQEELERQQAANVKKQQLQQQQSESKKLQPKPTAKSSSLSSSQSIVQSPADIFNLMNNQQQFQQQTSTNATAASAASTVNKQPLKSALKQSSQSTATAVKSLAVKFDAPSTNSLQQSAAIATATAAFSGSIIERGSVPSTVNTAATTATSAPTEAPKRISKFMQARMGLEDNY